MTTEQKPAPLAPQNNLPPAVRKQVADANALIAELNARPGEIPAGTQVQVMPGSETPGSMPTGQPTRWSPPPQPNPAQAGQPVPPVAHQPAPPSAAVSQAEDPAVWEQRYRSLQGKYDAETRMTREILAQQQMTMDKLIENQRAPITAPTPAAAQTPEEFLKTLGITDKEMEDYGELLPIVAKLARNMIQPTARKLEEELGRVRQAAGTTSAALVEDRKRAMFQTMDSNTAINGWRQINDDQNFLAWLDTFDLFLGSNRRVALMDAFQKLDTARVTAIFERYIQEDSARRSTFAPPVDANTLIAPGSPRGQSPEAPGGAQGKRILLESEVRDFYSRVRRKLVTPEQYAAFSAEIAAATAEGRIKPDRTDHHGNSR